MLQLNFGEFCDKLIYEVEKVKILLIILFYIIIIIIIIIIIFI